MRCFVMIFIMTFVFPIITLGDNVKVIEEIQNFSVTIKSGMSEGSGTIITRELKKTKDKDEKVIVNFILTAGHVVDDLRKVRTIIDKGTDKKLVEFNDASMVIEEVQDGRRVGESKMDCKVISFSDAENGEDLALLMVVKHGYRPKEVSAEFYQHDKIIPAGTQLWHCGSLLGQLGANSMTDGIMSQVGRVYKGKVYDQGTVVSFPGSSGGGVFIIENDKPLYIGMVTRGSGESFTLYVPVRRMYKWAEQNDLIWLFDKTKSAPSLEEVLKIPIEGKTSLNDENKDDSDDKKFTFLDGEHAKEWKKASFGITTLPQKN